MDTKYQRSIKTMNDTDCQNNNNNKVIKITAELLFKKPNTIQQRTENSYHSQCMQAVDVKNFFQKMQHKIN